MITRASFDFPGFRNMVESSLAAINTKAVYYYALRLRAREVVASSFIARFKRDGGKDNWNMITLASIDQSALDYARLEWPRFYSKENHEGFRYSWEILFHKFSNRPSYFDLAIWQQIGSQRVLQGLALGRPSRAKKHLTLNWVERSFAPSYMKGGILLPVLACAEEYAKLLNCERVLVKDPIDPSLYERYGYAPYKSPSKVTGRYHHKELRYDRGTNTFLGTIRPDDG